MSDSRSGFVSHAEQDFRVRVLVRLPTVNTHQKALGAMRVEMTIYKSIYSPHCKGSRGTPYLLEKKW